MFACWRGCGTIRRGATVSAGAAALADILATFAAPLVAGPAATFAPPAGATGGFGGVATTAAGRTGGAAFAAASACLRSRIAFSASPGLETLDRSNFGLASTAGLLAEPRLPPLKYPRTFSASSSSIELEWVFFSVTPTAVSASRIDLLFTSSSLAKSLIRTLFIPPFSVSLRP